MKIKKASALASIPFNLYIPLQTRTKLMKNSWADRADIPVERSSDQRRAVENTHAQSLLGGAL